MRASRNACIIHMMTHVPRRIEYIRPDNQTEVISEEEFASFAAPRILLGEPGAGKSKTAEAFAKRPGYAYFTADVLATGAPAPGLEDCIPVIDGLDETQGGGAEAPLLSILRRLHQLRSQSFILTCRAADWADVQNKRAVEAWFATAPVVGHLQPLDDAEITQMVDALGTYAGGGEDFLREAAARGAVDLARNPLALELLLAATQERGWPRTKAELYEAACDTFAAEQNGIHKSLNPTRPAVGRVLSAAGFVCAQLLLAGKRGVHVDGGGDEAFVRLADLESRDVPADDLRAVVSSLLFKTAGPGQVEPFHKTVAEYLAAGWLSEALRAGTLSFRRLETLLYKSGHVPGSLRALHAWLATRDRSLTDRLLPHDPYGCFRYGDIEQYSVEQARLLFRHLQELAVIDPYFRSEDWGGQVGGGLARPELRDDLVAVIRNPDVPSQLSTVILESLAGSDLAAAIRDDLRAIIVDVRIPYTNRNRAFDALSIANPGEDWRGLAEALAQLDDHGSARMAVETTIDHGRAFSGDEIARIAIAYEKINERDQVRLLLGMSYRLVPHMSQEQRVAALDVLASELPEERHNRSECTRNLEVLLLDTLKAYLEAGGEPSAHHLWRWLRHVTRHHYRAQDWSTFSLVYLGERPGLRRQVQAFVFDIASRDDRWLAKHYLVDATPGLIFQESDIAFHLEALVEREDQVNDFAERWRELVEWIFANASFSGSALVVAQRQAGNRPELKAIIDAISSRPQPQWQREDEQRQQREATEQKRKDRARHRAFAEIRTELQGGRHLGALHDVATAYMGLYSEVGEIADPVQRVEWLVGSENLEAALQGLVALCHAGELPSPREISDLNATEGKYQLSIRIALVGCAFLQAQGADLASLPRTSLLAALTACSWGLYTHDKHLPSDLEDALMAALFDHAAEMEPFIRDTIEPPLFAGKDHVSGLYDVMEAEAYTELARTLAVDWLRRSEEMSPQSLRQIFSAALAISDPSSLSSLIAEKLAAATWPNDEHRNYWHVAAFLVDFDRFRDAVTEFASQSPDRLNAIRSMRERLGKRPGRDLTVAQLEFLVQAFASAFPYVEPPGSGWGEDSAYEGARFIDGCISSLGGIHTLDAQGALERLVANADLSHHIDHARHVLAEHTRAMAEADWAKHTLGEVRQILLGGAPQSIEDLQSLVMDELAAMQERLQNGSFNEKRPFWNNSQPQRENHCRDLIAAQLEPHLGRYGVRVHTEGTMLDDTRCDLLCTIGAIDLPIEIKGQWHNEVWSAATLQLEGNYSRHYRANGRGVYLVAWFGDVPGYNPPGIRALGRPESAAAMLSAIPQRSPTPISEKTKLFVVDVSTSASAGNEATPSA